MSDEEQKAAYEKEAEAFDIGESIKDWDSFIVWQNFSRCSIESSNAKIGTKSEIYDLTDLMKGKLNFETGRKIVADQESDMNAFTCYILGHDSVADHALSFSETATSPGHFDIEWTGAVALSYVGNYNFEHRFRVDLKNVPFMGIEGPRYQELRIQKSFFGLFQKSDYYDLRQDRSLKSREAALRELAASCLKFEPEDFVFQAKDRFDWLVPDTRPQG